LRGAAGTPFCVIVKILPAITNRARRDCLPVFAATEYTTVPFPLLLSPSTILIQSALVKVVQPQRLLVETVLTRGHQKRVSSGLAHLTLSNCSKNFL
jgi:hypothetical protein